jgi:hypothetical protein
MLCLNELTTRDCCSLSAAYLVLHTSCPVGSNDGCMEHDQLVTYNLQGKSMLPMLHSPHVQHDQLR